jgi:ribosomal protein S18 acetylase RimI-like enzyme
MAHSTALPRGITIREASESDINEMIEVVNQAFVEESFFVNRPRTHAGQLAGQFETGRFLLAHDGAKLVASVYFEVRGDRGYIGMLAVLPAMQKRGLGRVMMEASESALREAGCKVAEITVVNVREALPPMYRKLGYVETGIEEPYEELRQKLTMPVKLIRMKKHFRPEPI